MKILRWLIFVIAFMITLGSAGQDSFTYRAPKKYLQAAFNYGKFEQEGFPSLHSDLGGSLTLSQSLWFLKPRSQRFKLGIDFGWLDLDYNYFKVKMISEQGGYFRYTFHQGNIGVLAGLGADFHITKSLRIHGRVCYNPALSCDYINEEINYGFASCFATGLMLTWKHIGLGIDFKFGKSKYKNMDSVDDVDDEDYENDEIYNESNGLELPGTFGSRESTKVNLFSVNFEYITFIVTAYSSNTIYIFTNIFIKNRMNKVNN